MSKEQIEQIAKDLQRALDRSQQVWDDKSESEAWIVGFLQGTIKRILIDLK